VLTENRIGQGTAYYVPLPLLSKHGKNVVPRALLEAVFDRVLPKEDRLLATDAPETVEVVLREQDGRRVVHLVNMHPGKREIITGGRRRYPMITEIPPVPECHVTVRLPARPKSVELQPQGTPLNGWTYEDGRLEVAVPSFGIHQMVVIEGGE